MLELFTGHSLWEYITVLFDNIPKVIYLIYTAVASCLDLLQCVMRKLAGLDTYWINGTAYTQQDPVLEFIFGMLGIGNNASTYSTLSTVFWSLAIFGLIVLVISTMIAIIKSHYNEDSNKTNPLTHIYTAIKAVFTFAIVPVAVVLGIYISQFLLQTMDNITAGKATEDTLRGIYGDTAASEFVSKDGVFTYYDFFGFGDKASSQTFSGMLFRVAAYDANRVRRGDYSVDALAANNQSANRVFGATDTPDQKNTSDQDWVAYQIDYAFMNNLHLRGGIYAAELYIAAGNSWGYGIGNTLVSIASVDFFTFVGGSAGFSKYNVGLVWYYYYLWSFNYFVGFAAIMISFGLLTGIIIGLMSRLIFGAALFLIFPPTLGLAPLDDWRAFKEWRKKFVAQIVMAFGSIIGINIFFLIFPYVNEFDWFGPSITASLPNSLINTLIIIVGLLTVKTFISFVSGMIASDDALSTGDSLKKDLAGTLTKTGGAVAGAGSIAVKSGALLLRQGAGIIKSVRAGSRVTGLDEKNKDISNELMASDARKSANLNAANAANVNLRSDYMTDAGGIASSDIKYQDELRSFNKKLAANGITNPEEIERMRAEMTDEYLTKTNKNHYADNKWIIENGGYANEDEIKRDEGLREELKSNKTKRQQLISSNFLNEEGNMDMNTFKLIGRQTWQNIGGAIMKGLKEGSKDLTGINMDTIKGVFQRFDNYHRDDKGKVDKIYGGITSNSEYREMKSMSRPERREARKEQMMNIADAMLNVAPAPPPSNSDSADKRMERSAEKLNRVADALLKATENLRRYRPR